MGLVARIMIMNDEGKFWLRLNVSINLVEGMRRLLEINRPLKAFNVFAKVSEHFRYDLRPPYCIHYVHQDAFATTYCCC